MGMGEYRAPRIWATFGAGAAANANITITGIAVGDEIIAAFHFAATSGILTTDLLSQMSITAANTVQNTTTNTTGGVVLVFWLKKN
jgi:hypothetical protein